MKCNKAYSLEPIRMRKFSLSITMIDLIKTYTMVRIKKENNDIFPMGIASGKPDAIPTENISLSSMGITFGKLNKGYIKDLTLHLR